MSRQTIEPRGVFVAALVTVDDTHLRRLADDGHTRGQTAFRQGVGQIPRAQTSNLFVIGEGEMKRPVTHPLCKMRGHRQSRGDKPLHVAGSATVKAPFCGLYAERIAGPGLIGHGHHIAVTRQQDTTIAVRPQRGEQVGLGPAGRGHHLAARAHVFQKPRHVQDHVEIAVRRNRRIGDQLCKDLGCALQVIHGSNP